MREVGVLEAKTHLSSLLDEVERGGELMITRKGKPIARVSRIEPEPYRPRVPPAERAKHFEAFRERIAREYPESLKITWEEIEADMEDLD